MFITQCPSCGEKIHLKSKPKVGQRINCAACQLAVRVISENPFALTAATQEGMQPTRVQRDQLHPVRAQHQKDLAELFEKEEFEGEPGVEPRWPDKKRSKNKKRRLAGHQFSFYDEEF